MSQPNAPTGVGRLVNLAIVILVPLLVLAFGGQRVEHEPTQLAVGTPSGSTGSDGGVEEIIEGTEGTEGTTEVIGGSGGSTSGGSGSGGGTSGGATPGTGGGTTPGGSGGSGGATFSAGTDSTGVTADSITVAVHAPVTGAAPLPATSFEEAGDLYWRWVISQGETVLGRSQVNVLFKDDKYTPASARQACRELAEQAFLLVGGGGTDQIQACGQFAEQTQVPYLSSGVTELGLRGLDWYFPISMSYKQQGPLLAQYIKQRFGDAKVALIVTDTANFDDAVEGWEAGVASQGLNYYKTLKHSKQDSTWYNTFGNELSQNGVEVVYMLTAPVDYIQFAQQNSGSGFQYVGVGITMGLNAILGSGCPHVDNGIFFSPAPGLDWVSENVPEFNQAAQQFGTPNDDIAFLLWSLATAQHEMFKRHGELIGDNLTREGFQQVSAAATGIETGIYGPISFSPERFGANTVHVLQANCGSEMHETLATFQTGF